jgi:hypothetical protein
MRIIYGFLMFMEVVVIPFILGIKCAQLGDIDSVIVIAIMTVVFWLYVACMLSEWKEDKQWKT